MLLRIYCGSGDSAEEQDAAVEEQADDADAEFIELSSIQDDDADALPVNDEM